MHTIRIEDDNDNAPYFTQDVFEFCVPENSKPGKNCFKLISTVTITYLNYVVKCCLFQFSGIAEVKFLCSKD